MAAFPIRIPKTSLAATEATVIEHLVDEGQPVTEGQPLYLLETEKVEQEIDAPASGLVHWSTSIQRGETCGIGTEIGHIETDG